MVGNNIEKMINAVIIEDELCFREMIQILLGDYFPDIKVVAQAESVDEAIQAIEEQKPDLVFLDIEIKGGNCFHVLQKLKNRDFKLIFITAYNEFAIQAIKFSAIDYILKPINEFEFKAGVEKALQEIDRNEKPSPLDNLLASRDGKRNKKLVLRTTQSIHVLNIDEIIRCEADNAYTTFFLDSGEKIMVSKGLCNYNELLLGNGFVSPHQSHLVNLNYIKKIDKRDGGFIILKDNTQIPISVRRKQDVLNILNKL